MISKMIECPKCKTRFTITGEPGEKKPVTCPNCNLKGYFSITEEKKKSTGYDVIVISDLGKKFKDVVAVDGASFSVKKGEIFGFLGPNGAGKTTTIKAMLGLIHMNSGKVTINGFDINKDYIKIKNDIGFLPERVSFYENLTPVQTLNFFCELKGVNKEVVPKLISDVGLNDAKNRKVGTFSKGMVQLLGFAQVQIGNPSVYVFDEPMSGLDARWVKIIREKIKSLNQQGATVMFSSHILSEVEALCDRVAIINKGKIIAQDNISNLNKYLKIMPRMEIKISGLNGKIPDFIKKIETVKDVYVKEDSLFLTCDSSFRSQIISELEKAGYKIIDFRTFEPSLEDAFIKLIEGDK